MTTPDTPDALLGHLDLLEEMTAIGLAAQLDSDLLDVVTDGLLDLVDDGTWDQPARLFAAIDLRRLRTRLGSDWDAMVRKVVGHDVPDAAMDAALDSGFSIVGLPFGDGEPYQRMLETEAPSWAAALLLVSEVWLHTDGPAPEGSVRRDDGAVEARLAYAMSRTGETCGRLQVSGTGERDTVPIGKDGRLVLAMAAALGVDVSPPTDLPWLALAGMWAEHAVGLLAAHPEVDDEQTAVLLLQRPDVVALGMRLVSVAAADAGGVDEPTAAFVHDALAPIRDAIASPDSRLLPEMLDAATRVMAQADWEEVAVVARTMTGNSQHIDDRAFDRIGPAGVLRMCGVDMPPAKATRMLDDLASLPGLPRWMRDAVTQVRDAAGNLTPAG